MRMATRILLSFMSLLALWSSFSLAVPVQSKSGQVLRTMRYDADSNTMSLEPDGKGPIIAFSILTPVYYKTGWDYLKVVTKDSYPDSVQAYAAGGLEAIAQPHQLYCYWASTIKDFCPKPYSKFCSKLHDFMEENLRWMKEQIHKDKTSNVHQPYWHQVELFLYQVAGFLDSFQKREMKPNTDIDPMFMNFYLMQLGGDLETLNAVLGNEETDRPLGTGSCSALVKLLPGNKELFVAHDTWNNYGSMVRMLKTYEFAWKTTFNGTEKIPGHTQVFSSYPGVMSSGDDYYLLSTGLATVETTIGNSNSSLWQYVTPQSVPETIRSVVANRLAKSGKEWAEIFSMYNSGTYNNEWLIVDYKRFKPGMKKLPPGVLTILDQIPGMIKYADLTDVLENQGYFPSYNVPYFPEVFNRSGNWNNVKKYGNWFTYDKTPRALIFKRDHVKVKDLKSMIKLMRYNDFKNDPLSRCNCTPPYSGENAISARSDLNPANGTYPFGALGHRSHGGTDMKVTSKELFEKLVIVAQGGPSWDQQPPFRWSTSGLNITHICQPDLWKFSPIVYNHPL